MLNWSYVFLQTLLQNKHFCIAPIRENICLDSKFEGNLIAFIKCLTQHTNSWHVGGDLTSFWLYNLEVQYMSYCNQYTLVYDSHQGMTPKRTQIYVFNSI